jgi:hypothetical protein
VTEESSEMWCHVLWCMGTSVLMRQIPLQEAAHSSETFISVYQTVRCHITDGKASHSYEYSKFYVQVSHVENVLKGNFVLYCLLFIVSCFKVHDTFLYMKHELVQNLVLNVRILVPFICVLNNCEQHVVTWDMSKVVFYLLEAVTFFTSLYLHNEL